MTKKGRPKSLDFAKNRVWHVVMSKEEERICRGITKLKGGSKKWFTRWVKRNFAEDFMKPTQIKLIKAVLKDRIKENAIQRDKLEDDLKKDGDWINRITEEEQNDKRKNKIN